MDFIDLATQCAPNVAPQTMAAIVSVESSHNPFAIGVVSGRLVRQPSTKADAIATAQLLERQGKNFSMGMAQVNRHNLPRYNVTYAQMFDACANLRVGALILEECYERALPLKGDPQAALRAAFSCYYSGNFSRGFRPDKPGEFSYVQKVVAASGQQASRVVVPAIEPASMSALKSMAKPVVTADPVMVHADTAVAPSPVDSADSGEPSQPGIAVESAASLSVDEPPGSSALVF